MTLERSLRGALAGSIAATVWAAQQPLDKRLFDSDYDDTELLGKLVTRGPEWRPIGLALHLQNGALFGAAYALGKPFIPGPPVLRGVVAALAEHAATWPSMRLVERYHPARGELGSLWGNRRALAQATWRHALFGAVLGALEHVLNDRSADEPPTIPVSSNGHGNLESAAVASVA
ncbi:MAG: hypothetical protein QOG41_286 [Thermoleophilaceae bacterium]|jgi:hypothetical protein|nr:hypothetical protein [Thermoleophilaceae bacterium]MEA2350815.1 hypothetical protein [Thermoleophilaceae bacterium]MEA2352232.1 hypothetical protein [Thermoleophilaceae bacterium]MEA2368342.1 hypothetical protein [Thermoleophilaceae bacterium]MEA2387513.1 hypothetical protein [Thermoleophilaceae bacterium]